MRGVVLDKSYVHGCQARELHDLSQRLSLFMPDVLFFELISTDAETQRRCFAKFPDGLNPVALIPNVGTLLRYEIETNRPSTPIYARREDRDFDFQINPMMAEGRFQFTDEQLRALREQVEEADSDARGLVVRFPEVSSLFGHLDYDPDTELEQFTEAASEEICSRPFLVKHIYQKLRDEEEHSGSPTPERIDPGWAFYRWIQVLVLSALWLRRRYPTGVPATAGESFWKRMEHNVHDLEYATLGALEGYLATSDAFVAELAKSVNPSTKIFGRS